MFGRHSRAWLVRFHQLSVNAGISACWLSRDHRVACRRPDLRAFTAVWSHVGRRMGPSCRTSMPGAVLPGWHLFLMQPIVRLPVCSGRPVFTRGCLTFASRRPQAKPQSPLFGFRSLQRILTWPARVAGSRPATHPASAFGYALAVFGATPLRGRLTSFAPATVVRSTDHAPPASFSAAFRYRGRKSWSLPVHPLALIRFSRTGNAHGIFNPSQPLSCSHVDRRSSRRHTPHAVS